MTIISVEHNPDTNTLIITLPRKTITLVYSSLPPVWEQDPTAYESFVVDYLNDQIEERTDRKAWLQSKDLNPNDPLPFTDSERQWYDDIADEVVFVEVIVTEAIWSSDRQEYLISVRNTSFDNPKV